MTLKKIAQERYATKKFNGKPIPQDKLNELLEIIRLAPSSFGLQPWVVQVISNAELKEKLSPASWGQAQITTCSHLLVFCAFTDIKSRIDQYEQMMKDAKAPVESTKTYIGMMRGFDEGLSAEHKLSWVQRQAYIALGNAVNGAKDLGFDSCPMEGFSPDEYAKILNLPKNVVPTVLVAVGYADDKPHPKIRYPMSDLFKFVK